MDATKNVLHFKDKSHCQVVLKLSAPFDATYDLVGSFQAFVRNRQKQVTMLYKKVSELSLENMGQNCHPEQKIRGYQFPVVDVGGSFIDIKGPSQSSPKSSPQKRLGKAKSVSEKKRLTAHNQTGSTFRLSNFHVFLR